MAAALCVACWFIPQNGEAQYRGRSGRFQAGFGFGFTADPTSFAFDFKTGYYFTENISLVPRFSVGFDDDFTLFFLMADGRYSFDIRNARLAELKPFVGFGLGATIAKPDQADADAAFTFEFPVGFDYYIRPNWSVGTEMQFMVPIGLSGDNFIFEWIVINGRYLF